MAKDDDADKRQDRDGMNLRVLQQQVKKSAERDRRAQLQRNELRQPQSRWQRIVRYVWDRKRP